MWPDSAFAHPVSSFERSVPLVGVDPDAAPAVFVSFNAKWLPYVIGALKQLTLQTTWATDDPNMWGLEQFRAMTLLSIFARATPVGEPGVAVSGDIDVSTPCQFLRWHDGKLQGLCCFNETTGQMDWEDIPGQEGGVLPSGATQPGSQPRPAAGDSKCFTVLLNANSQWQLPFAVNDGDQITISAVDGAWTDGALNWYCPDGTPFVLGQCVGAAGHSGGDPDATDFHMQVIAKIGSLFFPASGGTFTIPGGTGSQSLILQANDATLSDNRGSVSLKICVQSGATPPPSTWCYTEDFTLNDYGWTVVDGGVWTSGSGWDGTFHDPGSVSIVDIDKTLGGTFTITDIHFECTMNNGLGPNNHRRITTKLAGVTVQEDVTPGDGTTMDLTHGSYAIDEIQIAVNSGTGAGPDSIQRITISGTGANPFGGSNC